MKPTWKILCLASAFLAVSLCSFAQYPWPAEGEKGVDYFLNSKEKPKPDGLHYRTYQDGTLYYAAEFENGKPKAGTTMYYYYMEKAGALMTTHTFDSDPNKVLAVNYHLNGRQMSEGLYVKQKKSGEWKFFDPKGALQYTQEFENDLENGLHQTYYASGKVCKVETYQNGALNGPWEEKYEDQQTKAKGNYVDGDYDGIVLHYHPNGAKLSEGKYVNGLQEGSWLTFHSDGRVELNILYKQGKKVKEKKENGTFMEHYDSAIPKSEFSYTDGSLDGPFTEWYDQGEWIRQSRGGDQGFETEFVEELINTQIQREGNYVMGKLEGEVFHYDEDGRLIKTENYSNGELVSTE